MKYNSTLRKLLLGSVAVLPALTVSFTSGAAPSNLVYSRSSQATMIDASGNVVYGPNNLAINSQTLATWTFSAGSQGSATADAFGGTTAYPFLEDGTTGGHFVGLGLVTTAGALYQVQWVVKPGARSWVAPVFFDGTNSNRVWFNVSTGATGTTNGSVLGSGIVSLGGGWYRVWVSGTGTAAGGIRLSIGSADNTPSYAGSNGSTAAYVSAPQISQITAAQANAPVAYLATPSSAAAYGPRFTYDQTTAVTNYIRNSEMIGVNAGTNTGPTTWGLPTTPTNGISRQVVGSGIDPATGYTYTDVRLFGTPTSGSQYLDVDVAAGYSIPSKIGDKWAFSVYLALVGGSTTGFSNVQLVEYGSPSFSDNGSTIVTSSLTSSLQRFSSTVTFTHGDTSGVSPRVAFNINAGATVDLTIRVARPQLEFNVSTPGVYVANTSMSGPISGGAKALGFLPEGATTNQIRNSTMQGAVAGTPGTLPTNMTVSGSLDGLTRSTVVTTVGGIQYVGIRLAGTTTAGGSGIALEWETSNAIAAAAGQTWANSADLYYSGTAPSTAFGALSLGVVNFNTDGATSNGTQVGSDLRASIGTTPARFSSAFTLTNGTGTTGFTRPRVRFTTPPAGTTIDVTLFIGLPQIEQQPAATSPVPTYGSALARAAEVAYLDVSGLGLSASGYTVVQKGYMPADANTDVLLSGFDGSNNVGLNFYATGPTFTLSATDTGGATDGVNIGSGLGAGASYRFAVRVQAANLGAAVNGASGVTSTAIATPRVPTKLYLGYYGGNGTAYGNAPISSVTIYRTVMNGNQLLRAAA